MITRWWLAAAASAAGAATAAAQHEDVYLVVDGGVVVTTAGPDDGPVRVFGATFGEGGFPDRTTDPGFNTVAGRFPPGVAAGFTVERAVRKWQDGALCAIPPERITFTKNGVPTASPDADPGPGAARPSATVGLSDPFDGQMHEHGVFALGAPASAGVYVLEVRAWAGSPAAVSPAPSVPSWVVFAQNAPQADVDAVVAFLEAGLTAGRSGADLLCPPACAADFDGQGGMDLLDIFAFLEAWFAGCTGAGTPGPACVKSADHDGRNGVDLLDIFAFLEDWFSGCA